MSDLCFSGAGAAVTYCPQSGDGSTAAARALMSFPASPVLQVQPPTLQTAGTWSMKVSSSALRGYAVAALPPYKG